MDLTFPLTRKSDSLFKKTSSITGLIKPKFRGICQYSTAFTSEAAYIIGGVYPEYMNGEIIGENTGQIIAEFKNDSWRRFGTLSKGRANHGSISIGKEFMVIGGWHYNER